MLNIDPLMSPGADRLSLAEAMNPYFRDANPIREQRHAVASSLKQFRTQLGYPDIRGGTPSITVGSNHWRPWATALVAKRLRGIESDIWKEGVASDKTQDGAGFPIVAAVQFNGMAEIEGMLGEMESALNHYRQVAKEHFAILGGITTLFRTAITPLFTGGVFHYLTSGQTDLEIGVHMFFLSLTGSIMINATSTAGLVVDLGTPLAPQKTYDLLQKKLHWHHSAYNEDIRNGIVGRHLHTEDGIKDQSRALSIHTRGLFKLLAIPMKKVFVEDLGYRWLGIDRLITHNRETGEPTLTFVVRKSIKKPKYPAVERARQPAAAMQPAKLRHIIRG